MLTFTILQQGSDYSFIWPPLSAANSAAALRYVKTTLHPHQQAELQTAIDSAAQIANQLREPQARAHQFVDLQTRQPNGEHEQPLVRLGRLLFNHLLPLSLQEAIRRLPPATPILICTNDTELPWELLHDDQGFLALRHSLSRQMLIPVGSEHAATARPYQPLRCLLIGNPNGDLLAADTEIENLLEVFNLGSQQIRIEFLCREHASKMRVMTALASGDYDLIHFACHARPGALQLADDWLDAGEVQSLLRGQPLIFLNACSSGRTRQAEGENLTVIGQAVHNLAQAFLAGGAAAFVGMAWPVEDDDLRWLALEFYRQLLNGHTLAAATRQARVRTQGRAQLATSWSAPVLYGDPHHRLPSDSSPYQPGTVIAIRLKTMPTAQIETTAQPGPHHLQHLASQLVAILKGYGAELTTARADYLHALFGLPEPVEDDAVRALRAALEIRTSVEKEAAELSITVTIAIASGEVARSTLHAPTARGDSTPGAPPLYIGALFTEVDTLLAQCQPRQILINTRGRQLAKAHFYFVPLLDGSATQGNTEGNATDAVSFEVSALPVNVPPFAMPENAAPLGHLMGRQRELEFLFSTWQDASRGRGQVVGIAGEAGVGKTRLLQEFQRQLSSRSLWIDLACSSTGRDAPFRLVGQLLHKIFEIDASDSNEQAEAKIAIRLGNLPTGATIHNAQMNEILRETLGFATSELPIDERKARRGRLVHLLRTLMANEAQRQPLIVAIDDIHWMDEASLEVLAQLTEGIHRLPVQFVILYRPEWRHNWFDKAYYRHLHLEQLSHEASLELLCLLLQSEELPPGLTALLQKTGGNPFFIEEMVKSLQETGILVRREAPKPAPLKPGQSHTWELLRPLTEHYLPGTVDRALRVRLQSLTPATREVLEAAAVIGPIFTLSLLQQLLAPVADSVEPALAELEQRGFIEALWETQQHRFCHALILDSVYHALPSSHQQSWHRRIAEIMEAGASPTLNYEALAHHYYHSLLLSRPGETPKLDEQGHVQQASRGVNALIYCGRRALERFAAREAINYYQRALLLNGLVPESHHNELTCREGIGDAFNVLGDFDAAHRELRLAYGVLHTQPLDKATRRRAADLARRIGRLCAWRGEHDLAMQWMHEGLRQLGEFEDEDDKAVAALLHVHIGSVEYNRGQHDKVVTECELGLHLATATQRQLPAEAEANNMLGIIAWAQGRNQDALAHYAQSHAAWLRLGNSYQAARVAGNMGVAYFHLAQWEQARLQHARCQAYWEQIEDQDMLAHPCLNLGNIYLYQGDWEQAEENYGRALALWSKAHHQRFTSLGHTNLGLLFIEKEEWAKAKAHLEESYATLTQANIRDLLPEALYALAEVALGEGDLARAYQLAVEACTLARELAMRPEEALALRVLGRIALAQGKVDEARDLLQATLAILHDVENLYEQGRTLYYLAQVELAQGELTTHPAAASPYLDQAITLFTNLGAHHDHQRAVRLITTLSPLAITTRNTCSNSSKENLAMSDKQATPSAQGNEPERLNTETSISPEASVEEDRFQGTDEFLLDSAFKGYLQTHSLQQTSFEALVNDLDMNHVQFTRNRFERPGEIHFYILRHGQAASCRIYLIQPKSEDVLLFITPGANASTSSVAFNQVIGSSVAHGSVGASVIPYSLYPPNAAGNVNEPYQFQVMVEGNNKTTDDYLIIASRE